MFKHAWARKPIGSYKKKGHGGGDARTRKKAKKALRMNIERTLLQMTPCELSTQARIVGLQKELLEFTKTPVSGDRYSESLEKLMLKHARNNSNVKVDESMITRLGKLKKVEAERDATIQQKKMMIQKLKIRMKGIAQQKMAVIRRLKKMPLRKLRELKCCILRGEWERVLSSRRLERAHKGFNSCPKK